MPSNLGILISKTNKSGGRLIMPFKPCSPSKYLSTLKPSASNAKETDVKIFWSSSTKAILLAI